MNKHKYALKPVTLAIGVTFATSLVASQSVFAGNLPGENPFALNDLGAGYMQLAEKEGKCGEGKCGEGKKMKKEGKCGEGKKMEKEGKCGEGKKMEKEGKCGEGKKMKNEGKCGSK